jgi:hypothetical protein
MKLDYNRALSSAHDFVLASIGIGTRKTKLHIQVRHETVKIAIGKRSTTMFMVAAMCVLYMQLGEQACTSGARSPIVRGYIQLKNPFVLEYPSHTIDSADFTHSIPLPQSQLG